MRKILADNDGRETDLASNEIEAACCSPIAATEAAAMLVVGLGAGAAIAMMPGVLSAFVSAGQVTAAQSSRMGAFELAGITASMFGYGALLARFDRRRVAMISIVAIVLGQWICVWSHPIGILLPIRLWVGLSEGALIATVTAAIASSSSPERLFALWFSANLLVSAAFYAALPLLLSLGQMKGVMGAMVGLAAIALMALRWFPRGTPSGSAAAPGAQPVTGTRGKLVPAIFAMSASLVLFSGIGAVWPMMAQIGGANAVAIGTVATALSAASFAGVVSGLFTSWVGLWFGRTIPVIAGTIGLFLATIVLLDPSATAFTFSAVLFMACWIFNSTYYLGVVSALERSGRLATFTFALQFLGLTLGQILSTALLGSGSYSLLIIVSASFSLGALLVMMVAMRLALEPRSYRNPSQEMRMS